MLTRALIVLLVVLNLGAAAWWLTRPSPVPEPPPVLPAGVARLQLVDEASVPAASAAAAGAVVAARVPAVCFSLGPFTSEAAAHLARETLGAQLLRVQLREAPGTSASGYQVVMLPAASLEEAQATAARIGAAGFDDFLVVRQGEQANGIALGRYRSREAAERRLADLQAAGFAALLQPVGRAGPSLWWLDAGAAEDADAVALARRVSSGAPQPLDCAALR